MLAASAWLLTGGVLLGLALVALSQIVPRGRRALWPALLHGGLGVAAFGLLLLGLRGPVRGVQEGAGSFGTVAAWLLAAALCGGGLLGLARLRRRPPAALVIGVHATLGVAALVMLAAYVSA